MAVITRHSGVLGPVTPPRYDPAVERDLEVRGYDEEDEDAVLGLLAAAMGWVPDDQARAYFRWKHRANAFGPSPAWVAVDGERVVGLRILLRWEFESAGRTWRAVRAVDTATHPEYQGRGVFSRLTLHALEQLRAGGVDFVFNTPNDKSRPGYLKMGWREVTRLSLLVRPRSPLAAARLIAARQPAEKWSLACRFGEPAPEALALDDLDGVIGRARRRPGMHTRWSAAYLRWRYGFEPLQYRVHAGSEGLDGGFVVFRLRRRGPAVEAAVCEVVEPSDGPGRERALLREVVRGTRADYAIRIAGDGVARAGSIPLPSQGPVLVWREVAERTMPPAESWGVSLGDVELL